MKSFPSICRSLVLVCIIASAAPAGQIRIFTSHRLAGYTSPPELVPGTPEYQRAACFVPGQIIHVWAQASPGLLFDAIGLDLETFNGALINGPVSVPNPMIPSTPGHFFCRWNGTPLTGSPTVPPPVALLTGIKMVCIPIPGQTCEMVGVSNPVNSLNLQDGANDPATQSVMIASFKAAGTPGPGYFSVNVLLIVDYPQTYPDVYFGWGDTPVSGVIAGARSALPDWYVDYDMDNDGVTDMVDNCPTLFNSQQRDSDGDGRGDKCDACDYRKTGDLNDDGMVDADDVEAFAAMLLNETVVQGDDACAADADYSGTLDGRDVAAFTAILMQNDASGTIAPPFSSPLQQVVGVEISGAQQGTSFARTNGLSAVELNSSADWNGDGIVDGRDIAAYLNSQSADSPRSDAEVAQFIETLIGQ